VLGKEEVDYLESLGSNSRGDLIEKLFMLSPLAVIVSDGRAVPEDILTRADYSTTPLFSSDSTVRKLINFLLEYYASAFAEKSVLHGVFMEVQGIGVLLTGKSGIGKSELALELLSRGHRLVADDAPEFTRISPDTVNGRCPTLLQDFIEVRGLGILNVRSLFGDSAIKPDKNLRLIINLKEMEDLELLRMDRLEGNRTTRIFLDVEIPEITLPVAPGRNLAVLVESAASHHILRMKGYQPAQEFIRRQQRHLVEKGS
jgi:HPr kinase/phosphorylase